MNIDQNTIDINRNVKCEDKSFTILQILSEYTGEFLSRELFSQNRTIKRHAASLTSRAERVNRISMCDVYSLYVYKLHAHQRSFSVALWCTLVNSIRYIEKYKSTHLRRASDRVHRRKWLVFCCHRAPARRTS